MDIQELKGLPAQEAIKKAAAYAGVRPEVLDGVWNTETRRGQHPTLIGPPTKWGTAKGHFQQLDSITQEFSRRAGKALDPFDFHDGVYMAAMQFNENMQRYGDEKLAVLAYHGGTNQKNWGTKTQDYLRKVMGQAPVTAPRAGKANTAPGEKVAPEDWRAQLAQIGPVEHEAPGVAPSKPALEVRPVPMPLPLADAPAFASGMGAEVEAAGIKAATSAAAGARLEAAYVNQNQPTWEFIRGMTGAADNQEPDGAFLAAYAADVLKYESGFSQDERGYLREAVNQQDLDLRKQELLERRGRMDTIYKDGALSGFGYELGASLADPVGWVAGLGVGKVFQLAGAGSFALARAGRGGAALAAGGAEGLVGNVGYEAVLDAMGEYRSSSDYASAAVMGLVPGTLFSIPAYREASRVNLEKLQAGVLDELATAKVERLRTAIDSLGPNATAQDVARAAQRVEAEEFKGLQNAALAAAPEADRLPAGELVVEPEGGGIQADLRAETSFATEGAKYTADMQQAGDGAYSLARDLGMDLPDTPDAALRVAALEAADAQGGVVLHGAAKDSALYRQMGEVLGSLKKQFGLEDVTIHLTDGGSRLVSEDGAHRLQGLRSSIIAVKATGGYGTLVHEFGHAVLAHRLHTATPEVQDAMKAAWREWQALYDQPGRAQEAAMRRSPVSMYAKRPEAVVTGAAKGTWEGALRKLWDTAFPGQPEKAQEYGKYFANFDEFSAEQFAKFIETEAMGLGGGKLSVPKQIFQMVADLLRWGKELFGFAKEHDLIRPETPFKDFFDGLLDGKGAKGLSAFDPQFQAMAVPTGGFKGPAMLSPEQPRIMGADWELAKRHNLDLMPQTTPVEKAEFKAVLDIYRKAEAWVAANPRLDERARTLLNNSATFQITGTALSNSDNPVARMVAGVLLESTTGAQGRRPTAAIAHFHHERRFVGNSLNEYQLAYHKWAQLQGLSTGGRLVDDLLKGGHRAKFDKAVAQEIEGRLRSAAPTNDPLVRQAVDALEEGYERMRKAQVDTGSVGFAMLPDSARGYMPHVLAKERVINMTPAEQRLFVQAMAEQFQTIEGFDAKFSGELARKYVDHARVNANGGHEIPANIHQPGAGDMVRKALEDMGVGRDALVEMMQRFSRGGPSYTKKRLHLDLNKVYRDADGTELRLMDMFDTNQTELFRRYARRASGEVALAQYGVMGSQGLRLLRRAMEFGVDADKPQLREAFDQVAAEFLGQPFGDNHSRWMDRAMQANSLVRLGGMGFTQLGEVVNGIAHLGVLHTLRSIKDMPRLRRELLQIAKGEAVDNPVLASIEQWGGAGEFGADGYRMVLPFDNPDSVYHGYGQDSVTAVDKMLRAGTHAQGILSFWRSIHTVQQRGMAEQITLKAIKYIRDGGNDIALADMGFTSKMVKALQKDLPNMVTYDAAGRVAAFDLTKATNVEAAQAFAQSVSRGVSQIIQGTFTGETGKWAHDGLLKLFTQFRTFPLVAMEKQWARQRHNHGLAGALGLLVGSIAAVTPVIMARIAFSAIGRPDAEEYIESKMDPMVIGRMALNYVAMAGLAGDLVDMTSAVTGVGQEEGARSGGAKGAVGNLFAPGLGYVDDVYKTLQNPDDPHKWAQIMPMSRLPQLVPLVNMLRED